MFCSKHIDVKRHSVYFSEIKKNICRIFFGFKFISFPNRGVLSAVPCIYSLFIHTPPSSFPPWNAWPTSRILGQRATGGYGWPVRSVDVSSSSSTGTRRNAYVLLNPSATARYVKRPPTMKGAASNVAFRYILNLEAFRMDSRVSFDRFKYAATCGQVLEDRPFSYVPCIVSLLLQGRRGGIKEPSEMSVYGSTSYHRLWQVAGRCVR